MCLDVEDRKQEGRFYPGQPRKLTQDDMHNARGSIHMFQDADLDTKNLDAKPVTGKKLEHPKDGFRFRIDLQKSKYPAESVEIML